MFFGLDFDLNFELCLEVRVLSQDLSNQNLESGSQVQVWLVSKVLTAVDFRHGSLGRPPDGLASLTYHLPCFLCF